MGKFRLLSKREVDAQKARERHREIEEGKKLAGRVDGLRELASSEESGLEEFRIKQLTAIQAELGPKIQELAEVNSEIARKKTIRDQESVPIEEKWAEIRSAEAASRKEQEELTQRDAQLKLAIAANIEREHQNEAEHQRALAEHQRATEMLVQSAKVHDEARQTLKDAQEKDRVVNTALTLREKEVRAREESAVHVQEIQSKLGKRLETYEQNLFKKELQLRDREKTLERNISRNEK